MIDDIPLLFPYILISSTDFYWIPILEGDIPQLIPNKSQRFPTNAPLLIEIQLSIHILKNP